MNPEFAAKVKELRAILEKERVTLNDGNTPYKFTDKQGKEFWRTYESVSTTNKPVMRAFEE